MTNFYAMFATTNIALNEFANSPRGVALFSTKKERDIFVEHFEWSGFGKEWARKITAREALKLAGYTHSDYVDNKCIKNKIYYSRPGCGAQEITEIYYQ